MDYLVKNSVLCTVCSVIFIGIDAMLETVRSTLFNNAVSCPGYEINQSTNQPSGRP